MSEKIYAPISITEKAWPDGRPLWRVGIHAERMIEFLRTHANERDYVNLTMSERKTTGKHGDTHYAILDTFKPKAQPTDDPPPSPAVQAAKGAFAKPADEADDLPF